MKINQITSGNLVFENESLRERLKSSERELILNNEALQSSNSSQKKAEIERDNYRAINETLLQEIKERDQKLAAQRAILDSLDDKNLSKIEQTTNAKQVFFYFIFNIILIGNK